MPAGAPHPVWPPATPHIPTPNGHLPFPSSSAAPLSSIPPPYASSLLPRPPVSAPLYQPASPPAPVSSASATASVSTAPGYYQYAFAAASTGMGMGGGMGTFGSLNVPSFTAASPSYLPSNRCLHAPLPAWFCACACARACACGCMRVRRSVMPAGGLQTWFSAGVGVWLSN